MIAKKYEVGDLVMCLSKASKNWVSSEILERHEVHSGLGQRLGYRYVVKVSKYGATDVRDEKELKPFPVKVTIGPSKPISENSFVIPMECLPHYDVRRIPVNYWPSVIKEIGQIVSKASNNDIRIAYDPDTEMVEVSCRVKTE